MLKLQCFIGWVVQQFCFLFLFLQFIIYRFDTGHFKGARTRFICSKKKVEKKKKVISLNEFLPLRPSIPPTQCVLASKFHYEDNDPLDDVYLETSLMSQIK